MYTWSSGVQPGRMMTVEAQTNITLGCDVGSTSRCVGPCLTWPLLGCSVCQAAVATVVLLVHGWCWAHSLGSSQCSPLWIPVFCCKAGDALNPAGQVLAAAIGTTTKTQHTPNRLTPAYTRVPPFNEPCNHT